VATPQAMMLAHPSRMLAPSCRLNRTVWLTTTEITDTMV